MARRRREWLRREIITLLSQKEETVCLAEEMVCLAEQMVSLAGEMMVSLARNTVSEEMISLEACVLPTLTASPSK